MMMHIRHMWYPALIMIAATLLFWPHTVHAGFWPGGPLCMVDFESFARFAEWWLVAEGDLPADLYKDVDNVVNWLDLGVFVDYWLCYCPPDWPLK